MDLGLSQSTVAEARKRLGPLFFKGDENNPKLIDRINEVVERFHSMERWIGSLATFRVNVTDDKNIYLPYFLESINSAVIDKTPARVQGPRYEFVHDGPGLIDGETGIVNTIIDDGVYGIATDFPTTASTISLSAVAAGDAGKTVRILGYDQNGHWIADSEGVPGESVTLAITAVTTTNQFSGIKGIQKPLTRSSITVTHTGASKELARLENWMTNPRFRCYRVIDSGAQTVVALCKRRPIPVNYEEDYIFPGDLSAIKLGIFALHYEEESEPARMQQYFREAVELLNQSSASYKGGAQEQVNFEPWGPGIAGIGATY